MKEVWRNKRKHEKKKIMKDNKKSKETEWRGRGGEKKTRINTCVSQGGKSPNVEITLTQVYDILKLVVLFKCEFFVFSWFCFSFLIFFFSLFWEYFALFYFEQLARSPPYCSLFGLNDSCYSVSAHCCIARLLMFRQIFLCDDAMSLLFLRVRT